MQRKRTSRLFLWSHNRYETIWYVSQLPRFLTMFFLYVLHNDECLLCFLGSLGRCYLLSGTNNSCHLPGASFLPGPVPRIFHLSHHSVLTTTPGGKYYYYCDFINEALAAQGGSVSCQDHTAASHRSIAPLVKPDLNPANMSSEPMSLRALWLPCIICP